MALWTIANAQIATEDSLTKLYIATFDRAPDTVGLEYWIQSWLSLEEIAQSFFEQQETLEKYNGKSNRELIDIVYLNLFQREVDEEGLLYWQNALETQAVSRDKFILATMNGALGDDAILLNTKTTIWVSCQKSITREKFDTDDKYIAFLKEIINAPYALESWSCLLDEPVIVQDTLPTITKPTLVTRTEDSITVKGDITDSDGVKYTKTYRAYINNEEIASNTTGKFTDLEADTKYYFTIEWKVQNGASWDWEVVQSLKSSYIETKEKEVVNNYTPYYPPYVAPDDENSDDENDETLPEAPTALDWTFDANWESQTTVDLIDLFSPDDGKIIIVQWPTYWELTAVDGTKAFEYSATSANPEWNMEDTFTYKVERIEGEWDDAVTVTSEIKTVIIENIAND